MLEQFQAFLTGSEILIRVGVIGTGAMGQITSVFTARWRV
jgi:predicted homoserine dehydrogenase-like protein